MRKGFSQEGLKLVACITMLIDHIGYALVYPMYMQASMVSGVDMLGDAMPPEAKLLHAIYLLLRIIGRISFPIFAFLLAEGFHRTKNRKRYAIRLAVGILLAEVPYNLIVSGSPVWRQQQSIMVTLLLGFFALLAMERCSRLAWKPVVMIPFALAAKLLHTDYGWGGVVLIAMFELTRTMYNRNFIRFCGMLVLFHHMSSMTLWFGNMSVPMQALGALSMVFIAAYDGRKITGSKAVQWAFYLFYPVHLALLYAISLLPNVFQFGITVIT